MRANRRYFQEISKLTEELGLTVSDDEIVPEGMQMQLTKKQIKQFTEQGSLSPGAELRIVSTTSTKEKTWDHLTNPNVTDERYKQMLQSFRKRKLIEPDHPEMEIEDIKLKDIFSRTQLTINPKKLITAANAAQMRKTHLIEPSRIKQEPFTSGRFVVGSSSQFVGGKSMRGGKNAVGRPIRTFVTHSETDDEDLIMANIIKVEPQADAPIIKIKNEPKQVVRQTKIKTIYPQNAGKVIVNRKRPNTDNTQMRAGKKIIIDAGNVVKSSFVSKANAVPQNKRIVINSPRTIVMDPNDLIDDTDFEETESPESRHEMQACFLSLIRDIFCSTRDHRMKLEELRNRIRVWLANPIATVNEWFPQANDWGGLLISAVHFLSGEFQEQPDDFVPYLEFKSQLNIYQWIGAGRDSDARMRPLCSYWLSRRNEMGIKALKQKAPVKYAIAPENNEDNHLLQAVSPPNARCRTDWKVQPAADSELLAFRAQERERYERPHQSFIYRQHGYESVVGPLRGIYSPSPAAPKARDHNTLIADRPNFVTILALVRDAAARLPNGEGTRADICELLKSSQYIAHGTSDNVIQSIVSGALDRMHTEQDPCIKYDTKRKLWIYVHRNRSEGEFERLHVQQQIINKKKPVFKKTTKLDGSQQMITISSAQMRLVSAPNSIRSYTTTKVTASTSNMIKPIPALTAFENKQKIQSHSSPPPLKVSPKRYIKTIGSDRSMEAFDVEASLDAHTTPIVKTIDPKSRISLKNVSQMSPIRIITSSPATSTYVQSSPVLSGTQSFIINTNRSQSPKVGTLIGNKKFGGKPVIISQSQAPPLVSQSSPNTGQSYLIPINMNASGAKIVKTSSEPPALAGKTGQLQQKNVIKVNPSTGKTVMNPQQKIILTTSGALQGQKGGKILSTMTIPKSQSPVTMLSQQKQILTNVIVQQQKAKGQNQILMTGGPQKMPGLTITSQATTTSAPQVIQIQQSSADGKFTTVSTANLTPQQRQTIFQSLKLKQGVNQTMIVKPQVAKSMAGDNPAPPLVSVSGSVGKILKTGATTMVQQPQVMVSMAQKTEGGNSPFVARVVSAGTRQLIDGIMPKTTFKIAGGTAGAQSGLIQISGAGGSQQYAVVSKGKNIISIGNQGKMITTQANIVGNVSLSPSQSIATSTGNVMIATSQSQQSVQTSTQNQAIKIVQGGSITAQQLLGAKLFNVQTLANKGIKTTGGIKMLNSQNYIANIGGKPLIISNKANATGGNNTTGGLVLQASNSPNGSFILNSQGQPMKVQGNILTQGNVNMLNQTTSQPQHVMLGNQIVKVHSLNQMQQKVNIQNAGGANSSQDGQRPLILGGSTIKVLKNVIKSNAQPQQQGQRVVLAAPGTQGGQFSQQIILPANFQGIKGLKVIPMAQQGTGDRVFTTRLMTNPNATTNNNISNANANKVASSQDEVKE